MAAMIQRMARIGRGRVATIVAALLLGGGALAALPAPAASAASSAVSWWNVGGSAVELTFFCDNPQLSTLPSGDYALEVYNPCGYRVWLHAYSGSTIYAYCVNPGGGLAYALPRHYTDIQVTTNPALCDNASNNHAHVTWLGPGTNNIVGFNYTCQRLDSKYVQGYWVNEVGNSCNVRMWLHQYDNGTGAALCVDAGQVVPGGLGWTSPVYWQVQVTTNEAPCNAGGPPYPY